MDRIKLFLIWAIVVFTSAGAFAAPYSIPKDGTRRMWNEGANSWCSYINPLFNYFDATGGVLPEYPVVLGPLSVSGAGDSWLELGNNTSFTDALTGKGGYGLLNWLPYAILNGEQKRLALFEELAAGDTSVIQDDDPTLASATGKYYSRASGGYFNVVHGVEMFALAGTRTADETAPVIVAGADSTHDGTTAVTATMVLTELYPDPSTLLYTVTGGTPASGTWAGTYPNYSVEITPTGTDPIVVTSSASDLAGNVETGTDLIQEFAYDDPVVDGSIGYIIGSGTSITPSSTNLYTLCTSADGSGIYPSASGTVSFGHIYLPGVIPARTVCLSIKDSSGNNLASGSLSTSGTDYWVNITLDTPITISTGQKYFPCFFNAGRVESGAQSGIAVDYQSAATCAGTYTKSGDYIGGAISLIFNNTSGSPE